MSCDLLVDRSSFHFGVSRVALITVALPKPAYGSRFGTLLARPFTWQMSIMLESCRLRERCAGQQNRSWPL
jgi:hypothetical protein